MSAESQCIQVLRFIRKHGSITSFQAFKAIKPACTRLSGRIYDLKGDGYPITGRMVQKGKTRFKEYRLA